MHVILKKKYGQNFLIDKNIILKICKLIPSKNLNILEIGPGDGKLTENIIKNQPNKLVIVEIDTDLILILKNKFKKESNIVIINEDILKFKFNSKLDLIISNLPYNISSQILAKICSLKNSPKHLIFMFQKEFALRLLDKKLNSINSLVNCFYDIKSKFNVSRTCFRPVPKIESSVLLFIKKSYPLIHLNEVDNFIIFKRKLFSHKRKSLKNILKSYDLSNNDLNLNTRVENLNIEELINVFKSIKI